LNSLNGEAIEAVRRDMNRLRGRMFQAIESAGLPDKQEDALKGVIRAQTYDAQADLEAILRGVQ
jgi:hypothetical protein